MQHYVHVTLAHCLQPVPVAWAMCHVLCLGIRQAVEQPQLWAHHC